MVDNSLLFIYGRTPELARYEAQSVYPHAEFTQLTNECDWVQKITVSPKESMDRLGGIIRVAQEIEIIEELTPELIAKSILKDQKDSTEEISFILSTLGNTPLPSRISHVVKTILHDAGRSSRYVLPSKQPLASAAQVYNRKTLEYLCISLPKGVLIARTQAVQDSTSWSKRDFDRPYADAKRGMLPLKVARMVVNIAAGEQIEGRTFADPFCGMGTIISEGLFLGGRWYGSDVSEKAVFATEKNVNWLKVHTSVSFEMPVLFVGDAVHLSKNIAPNSLDAIVTEPFLGNPSLGEGKITENIDIHNILKGLDKMYIGSFKNWYNLLKDGGKIVIAVPLIQRGEHKQTVKKLIDTCETLGYSIEAGPFEYSRPNAIVKRHFYIFKKLPVKLI